MKDRFLLIVVSLACSVGAWAFWRFSGRDGFLILLTILCAGLSADNYRLRKTLRSHIFKA